MRISTTIVLCGFAACLGFAQTQTVRPAEEAFKNIQVLKGVPENEIQPTMWFFTAALGVRCRFCHEDENDRREMDTRPQKAIARKMIAMTMALNKNSFGGRTVVTCNTCHRGNAHPVGVPAIGADTPTVIEGEAKPAPAPATPTAEQIMSKYDSAVGSANASKAVNLALKGTVADLKGKKAPIEIMVKAAGTRVLVTHAGDEESISALNGATGWATGENGARNMRPSELEAAKLEDPFYINGRVGQVFTDLRVLPRPEKIDNRPAYVVAARSTGQSGVKLYFDSESGLLSRLVYDTDTVFGPYVTQIDYADYRDMGGLKAPYHWKISRVRADVSDYQISEVKTNASISDALFAKPAPRPKEAK